MKRKTGIILSIILIGGITGYVVYIKRRNKNIYDQLMNTLKSGAKSTGTIADAKETDSEWNPSYWANLVKGKQMLLSQFNLKSAQSSANNIYNNLNDDGIVNLLLSLPNKAQSSYLAYEYLQASGKKQTLLQKVKSMSSDRAQKVYDYLSNLPNM